MESASLGPTIILRSLAFPGAVMVKLSTQVERLTARRVARRVASLPGLGKKVGLISEN